VEEVKRENRYRDGNEVKDMICMRNVGDENLR